MSFTINKQVLWLLVWSRSVFIAIHRSSSCPPSRGQPWSNKSDTKLKLNGFFKQTFNSNWRLGIKSKNRPQSISETLGLTKTVTAWTFMMESFAFFQYRLKLLELWDKFRPSLLSNDGYSKSHTPLCFPLKGVQSECSIERRHRWKGYKSNSSSVVYRVSPFWVTVQVEHGDAPRVHRQRDGEDAQDVHDEASFYLRTKEDSQEELLLQRMLNVKIQSKAVTMSLTMRCPDAKAMEFGGVETGSINAYEHPTVAGIMKYRGFTETRMACRHWD